jgi:anti-sigma factor RsiW
MKPPNPEPDCSEAREAIHASLDADLMDAVQRRDLEAHLARCAPCREHAAELRRVQDALRSLPELELPEEALERVWQRTTRSSRLPFRPRLRDLVASAAAVLLVAVVGLWLYEGSAPPGPTDAELERAAREARLVLGVASRALQRSEEVAIRDVLAEEVSPALRRAPIRWPEPSAGERRGS